ncbi:methyltransferase [uncultured Gimesia sp.]|uniref:methyltransferase n=1 Tax=uncultured Gimesia sp. TaxID=1678688 RepID=UPI0030D84FFC|tara:strand:- start:2911 stop:4056 length:1146 start_codon:yes stop_codon:yes gene_type:complete
MSNWTQEGILRRYHEEAKRGRPYTWFNYQPINLPGYEETLSNCGRKCFDRSEAISAHLQSVFGDKPLKIIDWGCNLGFFCFELAKLGHQVTGVDSDRDNVELCRFLARTNSFPNKPQFFHDGLSVESLHNFYDYDIALCFSVLHHLGKQKVQTLKTMAEAYPHAYIEMDGAGYGFNLLFAFYWQLEEIAETNDRYGSGHRTRKTWYGSNRCNGSDYRSIKERNLVGSRGVFRIKRDQKTTVVKREINTGNTHTWIQTDLSHEREMYRKLEGVRFFPQLLDSGTENGFQWIELEYVQENGCFSADELSQFYDYLAENNLFMLDLTPDSFLFTDGRLKVIDLESLFPVEHTLDDLIRVQTRRSSLSLDSYDKQLRYLLKRFVG